MCFLHLYFQPWQLPLDFLFILNLGLYKQVDSWLFSSPFADYLMKPLKALVQMCPFLSIILLYMLWILIQNTFFSFNLILYHQIEISDESRNFTQFEMSVFQFLDFPYHFNWFLCYFHLFSLQFEFSYYYLKFCIDIDFQNNNFTFLLLLVYLHS